MSKAEAKAKQFGTLASRAQFLLGANIAAGIFYISDAERLSGIYMRHLMSGCGAVLALIVLASAIEIEWRFQQISVFEVEIPASEVSLLNSGKWMAIACTISAGALLWGALDYGLYLLGAYDATALEEATELTVPDPVPNLEMQPAKPTTKVGE